MFVKFKLVRFNTSIDIFFSGCVVPGAGATEIAIYRELQKFKETVKGKARLGIQAFAEAMLVLPKTLGKNFN